MKTGRIATRILCALTCALTCARAVLWSTLGVVDDGRTDNTAALTALPVGTLVEGDCPHSGVVLAQGLWYLRSQLWLEVQAGCEVLSNSTGVGSYALSQKDLSVPLYNVSLVGLTVSKTTKVAGDRVLMAYIDNFQLINWTFYNHGGAMFLRGSCQEVAGGVSYDAAPEVGSPGLRHIGNLPKAACLRPQPANVWVHHNSIISGDGAYQACQPLNNAVWTNVYSDDLLFEENTGGSSSSAFILLGLSNKPQNSAFVCSNVTFRAMQGSGLRLIYVEAGAAPNLVERVAFQDLLLNRTPHASYSPASIQLSSLHGGAVRSVLMDGVRALSTWVTGLNESGTLESVVFTNGELSTPALGGGPNVCISGGTSAVLSNSTIGAFNGDNVQIGAQAQNTQVLNCRLAGVNAGSAGVALGSANGTSVLGNQFIAERGAPNTTGIALDAATTRANVHFNDVRGMAAGILCGHGSGNNVSNNPGAEDCA